MTVHDIISITNSLRNTNKLYDVPTKFLKLIINVVADIITDLFNECILEGHFPTELMTSRLMPLYKQGSKLQMENYRPISLLPTLSKIFEKVLSTQYLSFIDKHNLLSNNQFGFRKNLNTTDAALKLVNDMVPVFQNKRYGACLFVDFRKAFDTLDRDILLRKLFRMGVRGIGHEILNSYYKGDRKQYVHVNGVSSDLLDSKNGCIQGSNLGPLMYILYADDLNKIFDDSVQLVTFADDTVIYIKGESTHELQDKINQIVEKLIDWCNNNKLCVNFEKKRKLCFYLPVKSEM